MRTWILPILVLFAGTAQAEEKCQLQQVASVPMTTTSEGVTVPMAIGDETASFLLDIRDGFSLISASYAKRRGLPRSDISRRFRFTDIQLDGNATIPELSIGQLHFKNVTMPRVDTPKFGKDGIEGVIGLDQLSGYDVELDFKSGKMNLYSLGLCPGNVVYWASSYAVIPFTIDAANHPSIAAKLDGKDVTAGFDLETEFGVINSAPARRIFGISMEGLTKVDGLPQGMPATYKYPFNTLQIGAFSFAHPEVYIWDFESDCRVTPRCFGASDITIGSHELRQLHLYFAFKEGKLYATTADAHR